MIMLGSHNACPSTVFMCAFIINLVAVSDKITMILPREAIKKIKGFNKELFLKGGRGSI